MSLIIIMLNIIYIYIYIYIHIYIYLNICISFNCYSLITNFLFILFISYDFFGIFAN